MVKKAPTAAQKRALLVKEAKRLRALPKGADYAAVSDKVLRAKIMHKLRQMVASEKAEKYLPKGVGLATATKSQLEHAMSRRVSVLLAKASVVAGVAILVGASAATAVNVAQREKQAKAREQQRRDDEKAREEQQRQSKAKTQERFEKETEERTRRGNEREQAAWERQRGGDPKRAACAELARVLGIPESDCAAMPCETFDKLYKAARLKAHPDKGGSTEKVDNVRIAKAVRKARCP